MGFKFNPFTANLDIVVDYSNRKNTYVINKSGDRVSSVVINGTTTYTNTYDAYGKISSVTDGTNTWTITRDQNGGEIAEVA